MASRLFRAHGEFCTSHPWEVIVATLTLTLCLLTLDQQPVPPYKPAIKTCLGCIQEAEHNAVDLIGMTVIRSISVLYCYWQFRKLQKLGSKYILGIAGLFTVFSSFIFTSTVVNTLRIKVSDLKDALFFFLLLIDLPKAVRLAQFGLRGKDHAEVKNYIAKGLSVFGPTITLDTLVETLVIGVGTLSGVERLEMLSWFACLSVLVNYLVFMTFYPACLSLMFELSRSTNIYKTKESLISIAFKEEEYKSNPVVERVKLIMSAGLMVVHGYSRWPFKDSEVHTIGPLVLQQSLNSTEEVSHLHGIFVRWLVPASDHIVVLTIFFTLAAKFIFFDPKEDTDSKKKSYMSQRSRVTTQKSPMPVLNFTFNEPVFEHKEVQTTPDSSEEETTREDENIPRLCRSLEDCLTIYNNIDLGVTELSDEEIILLIKNKHIATYQIEKAIDDPLRGVRIRRKILENDLLKRPNSLEELPYKSYDYSKVMGACCENVIGYMPIPLGYAGPLLMDGKELLIPMATTEGCLVASTNRGCRALRENGVTSCVVSDGMTRGPVVRFPTTVRACEAMRWMQEPKNFTIIKERFDSSSRFARLQRITTKIAGKNLYIRFVATTGDAMGMNMLSKGTEFSLKYVQQEFQDMEILSLSGNFCTDKKPSAVNWIEGRGKSVVCEAIVPAKIIKNVLKTNTHALIDVNIAKNLIGSAMAGSIGGFNAHAANIVTAIFIATGQDPAQNIGSSNCMTLMEAWGPDGEDLYISCSMPSIEVGTIGGGTILPAQGACLDMIGVKGSNVVEPGANACQLARIVCATVLAGELSLMSSLTAGDLVKSHLRHNRSTTLLPEAFDRSKNVFLPPCKDNV